MPMGLFKRKSIDERHLRHMYVAKRMTTVEIAQHYGCNDETIRNRLSDFGIKRRRDGPRYVRTVKHLSMTQRAYLAGIVDGEGTITLAKSTRSVGGITPLFSVTNTDVGLIQWLKNNVGGNVTVKPAEKSHYKTGYRWYTYSVRDVLELIKMVYPYLIVKRDNAEEVLSFCKWRISLAEKSRETPKVYAFQENGKFASVEPTIYVRTEDE